MAEGILMPTTQAQVSGHKFLVRRIEHGLVMGDVRMIHDPLSRRRRALVFGAVACVLLVVGSLALALFRPAIDPGDAPIIRAESGALYVQLEEAVHPVVNVASARLIIGEAVDPVNASDEIIAAMPQGVPIGLVDAPGVIATDQPPDSTWLGCQSVQSGAMHVEVVGADAQLRWLGEGEALLAASQSGTYIVSSEGRRALPARDSPEGRIVRRHLGIDEATPRMHITADLLNLIPELPAITMPTPLPTLVEIGARSWLQLPDGLQTITALQQGMLIDAGSHSAQDQRAALGGYPISEGIELHLPSTLMEWVDVFDRVVCADGRGGIALIEEQEMGVALSGQAIAQRFHSPLPGAVGVDSGFGYYLVAASGLRHHVIDGASMSALGISDVQEVSWTVLRLLPEGSELSGAAARQAIY